jgi:preprotein translocase subunit SecE
MQQIRLYFKESINELFNHVTWPTWPELLSSATLVLVATGILALVIFLMDAISKAAMEFIYTF